MLNLFYLVQEGMFASTVYRKWAFSNSPTKAGDEEDSAGALLQAISVRYLGWGGTIDRFGIRHVDIISIHPPRAGWDHVASGKGQGG